MRRFYLLNTIGQQINLQDKDHYFLHNPAGLGFTQNGEYLSAGDSFYVLTDRTPQQINITGDLIFPGKDPYVDFKALVDWAHSGYDLVFGYSPNGTQTYYVDADIEGLDKTEMRGGFLTCPLSILGRSPWYNQNPIIQDMMPETEENIMAYDFEMESYFPLSTQVNSRDVTPVGHYPAALKIIAQGPMDNPVITIKDKATGTVVGKTDLTGLSIPLGSTLLYSSVPGETDGQPNTGVWVVNAVGARMDVSGYLSMENINFARIPVGRESTISLEFSGESVGYRLHLYQYRKAV